MCMENVSHALLENLKSIESNSRIETTQVTTEEKEKTFVL